MLNDDEQQNRQNTQSTPEGANAHATPVRTKRSFTSLICFFFALAALLIALYDYQVSRSMHNLLIEKNKVLSQRLRQQQDMIQEQHQTTERQQEHVEQQLIQLNHKTQQALRQNTNQNQDWLLLKARYYLELAQIDAHWCKDTQSTIELLQQADNLLMQVHDSNLFNIRQIIAKELTQLKGHKPLDLVGLLSQLDALKTAVGQLSMQINPTSLVTTKDAAVAQTENRAPWKTQLQNSMNLLSKLVLVRHHDEDIQPLLTPFYVALIRESIYLNIQEAQWALIHQNSMIYQWALRQITDHIKQHFPFNTTNTATLLNQLDQLKNSFLTPEHLSVSQALPLINQLIEQNNLQAPADNTAHGERQP